MTIKLSVLMQTDILSFTSPSHDIRVTGYSFTKHQEYFINTAEFSGNTEMMDRDFIVFVDSAEPNKPKVLVEKDEESHVAMLTFVPDFHLVEQNIEAIFEKLMTVVSNLVVIIAILDSSFFCQN